MPGLSRPSGVLRDTATVLVWFAVAGILAAVVWWQVTPLPVFTRTSAGAVMDQVQLSRLVAVDGWYFVVAAAFGVVSGVVLTAWRRRDPVFTVVLVACGGVLAAWVAIGLGLWLGPPDPHQALDHLANGGHAPVQLRLTSQAVWLIWPMAALLGAVGALWGSSADSR